MPEIVVYLLHFTQPVGRARHYLGSTTLREFNTRMKRHQAGTGAALTSRAVELDIGWWIARTWIVETRADERRAKKRGHFATLCPFCNGEQSHTHLEATKRYVPPLRATKGREISWPDASTTKKRPQTKDGAGLGARSSAPRSCGQP